MAERDQSHQPSHRAYSVIKREGQDDFWLNLGLGFPHKDGKGLNVILQAYPLDGKIVLREVSTTTRRHRATRAATSVLDVPVAGRWPRRRPPGELSSSTPSNSPQLPDGAMFVSMMATSVDGEEPQLLCQEITSDACCFDR